ncbi:hypothetical protein BAE29_12700 [Acidithiobacillus caldus]|jgi:hypothetical protein|nr:hypothetical protein BAE27_11370 [Acidithiobacillus caldus]OFC36497.1 hypothetical protein BAE28_08680 [Acidithiobacillus caldus]OFC36539.1 hypothetical protein BAE29_12700 [Acidithiobacillus caldus]OFC52164.1 hypothetical protein BAE30_12225 [Acidithiobacillus caldus]
MHARRLDHLNIQEPPQENRLVEFLDVLEERHQIVRESWEKVIRMLPDGCTEDLDQQKIVMDTELARYRRYLLLVRDRILRTERQLLLEL